MTASQLVQNVLFNSSCATVTNVSVSGGNFVTGETSWGYFNANGSSFPFADGIILSTGRIANAQGPNAYVSDDGAGMSWGSDPDLNQALSINNTLNATVLEFDFTPYGDQISFDYIFASEEYHGTATCTYSDGFAFLLKPASGGTYQNLALIPNTSIPVKVTTVHPAIPGACPAQNEAYFDAFNGYDYPTNFNGQTKVLTARASVIPGTVYHIKLVIADEGNYRYDSAIFLKGSSFNFGVDLGTDRLFTSQNPVCPNETVTLNANSPTATHFQWSYNGTPIPGENNNTLTLTPPHSSSMNGVYSVDVTYNPTCTITSEINLEFAPDLVVNQNLFTYCDEDENGITTVALDAITPFLFSNLPSTYTVAYFDSPTSTQALPANYQNTNPFSQTLYVKITSNSCYNVYPITLSILPFGAEIADETIGVCNGNPALLQADTGYPSYLWNTGETTTTITVTTNGTYTVMITNSAGCTRLKTFTVVTSEIAQITNISTSELGENNTVTIDVSGTGDYVYSLDGVHYQLSPVFYEVPMGEQIVYVLDQNRCGTASKSFLMVGVPKFFTPNNDGFNDYWNISGLKPERHQNTMVSVFDRFGKLIKQFSATGPGWNGEMNGLPLPADDYWYCIETETGLTNRGHFTLKR